MAVKKPRKITLKGKSYDNLLANIGDILEQGRRQAIRTLNLPTPFLRQYFRIKHLE